MITIHLHGPQAHLVPGPLSFAVETVAEAIKAFSSQMKHVLRPVPGQERIVYSGSNARTPDDLLKIRDEDVEVHLVPSILGGGGKGGLMSILMIVVGILIIAVTWWTGFGAAAGASLIATSMAGMLYGMGASLILGGLLSLMSTPAPDNTANQDTTFTTTPDPSSSRYLGSPKNTVKSGTRVNLAFGENLIPGHFLSFNIDSTDGVGTALKPVIVTTDPDIPEDGSAANVPSESYP